MRPNGSKIAIASDGADRRWRRRWGSRAGTAAREPNDAGPARKRACGDRAAHPPHPSSRTDRVLQRLTRRPACPTLAAGISAGPRCPRPVAKLWLRRWAHSA